MRVINCRELRAQLERDHPILLRPHTTDPEVIRDMIARSGLDRRDHKRPEAAERRKAEQ